MAKKRVLIRSMAVVASVGMLAAGCRDEHEYGAKTAPAKKVDQFAPGIGNYPDTQGNAYLSGTGYYDSARAGVAGSALDKVPGLTTDTFRIKATPPKTSVEKGKPTSTEMDSTLPATGPGNPGGPGGSSMGSDAGMPGGTGGGMSMPGSGGSNSGSGTGGY